MKKIKIAQIGVMHDHARDTIRTLKAMRDVFELIGFAHPDSESYNESLYSGVQEMTVDEILNYPGLDAVVIETREQDLTDYALLAAEKGIHIHLDKPGGLELEAFDRLIDMVKEKKLVFSMGYMYRFNPNVQKALALVKSGKIGEVYAVEAHMSCYLPADKRQWLDQFPGGMMFYLGCHLIDLILQFKGSVPDKILPFHGPLGIENTTSNDYSMAILMYDGIASFAKTCGAEHGGFLRRQLVICGTEGVIEIKPMEYHPVLGERDLQSDLRVTYKEESLAKGVDALGDTEPSGPYDRYISMLQKFADTITGKIENTYDPEYERQLYKAVWESCGRAFE